jgi:signal transduction histidine kinase
MATRVNTSSSSISRASVGLFSTVLGAVLLLMLSALVAADRALGSASREAAAIDATESSRLIEQALTGQIEILQTFRAPFLGGEAERDHELDALTDDYADDATALRGLWVLDSAGKILYQSASAAVRPSTGPPPAAPLVRVDNAHGARMLMVTVPLAAEGKTYGSVVARFDPVRLFSAALDSAPRPRARLVLRAGKDTILGVVPRAELLSLTWRQASVHGPGAGWTLSIAHAESSQALRITLWTLGLVAVIVLGGGVIRERRQALRVAERSAELERLSSELLRANRMKSEFLANVSHELRTPLNAIVGFVDLLRDGVYGDLTARQAPPVERIAASATHLRHLVDQVLDIAKIAAGRLEVHAETIVLRPFVLNVVSELEPLITERGLNLSIAVGASLPRVRTDPTHLRQILVNLIGNAIKYTPAGGIAIRARMTGLTSATDVRRPSPEDPTLLSRSPDKRKSWIALQVIDTGIGIAPADQERIFDEFEQVNAGPRTDSMERGTGLGLAISRRLARLLGGEIAVESQAGKGSTFTIWLPVSPADMQSEREEMAPNQTQAVV